MLRFLQTETFLFPFRLFFGKVPEESELLPMKKKFKADEDPIVLNIARGFYWQEMIDNGKIANVRELANILNVNESYVARTIRLSMLSPEIIHRAIRGTLPPDISLAKLYKLSSRWDEQLQQLGIAVE